MSIESVQNIIGRAASDATFRALLFRDPGQALAGYDLTDAEIVTLRNLTPEAFTSGIADLEARISRSVVLGRGAEEAQKMGGQ
jgi:hypothetical protein